MASCMASSLFLKHLLLVVALPLLISSTPAPGCHDSIISFGDSLADTGNLLHLSSSDGRPTEAGFLPYGETYFHRPTGRFSDGRLVIDFVAEWLGLPYVAPYYGDDGGRSVADFGKGVNLAVAGATALDAGFFEGRGMGNSFPNESLGVQLGLFKELLPSLCNTSSEFQSSDKEEYDPLTGCLNWLNEFSQYHNEQLQRRLDHLRELHPRANIIYVDYYNAALRFYQSPDKFGFDGGILSACCGGGGTYNYNLSALCNSNARVCDDPSSYASWDGIHFTEAAYRWIFKSMADGSCTVPKLDISCPSVAFE
ncbi:GDSL esterase/lipase At1g28590-like isoform X5 [Syzygium oleosum]|uniref:GDSL esterase/lipase At1g28590-like isoform X5 n=1 Tax=Syzygium oleosum TaxID=219896 RepID=UPI0024B9FAB2|nr:GDSL esterase/lipase At1g28590-like isoform X5 [Syzygium oleosum]